MSTTYTHYTPEIVSGTRRRKGEESEMDFVVGLIQSAITLGAIALILVLVAGLFMIVFSLGTMLDKRISDQ